MRSIPPKVGITHPLSGGGCVSLAMVGGDWQLTARSISVRPRPMLIERHPGRAPFPVVPRPPQRKKLQRKGPAQNFSRFLCPGQRHRQGQRPATLEWVGLDGVRHRAPLTQYLESPEVGHYFVSRHSPPATIAFCWCAVVRLGGTEYTITGDSVAAVWDRFDALLRLARASHI